MKFAFAEIQTLPQKVAYEGKHGHNCCGKKCNVCYDSQFPYCVFFALFMDVPGTCLYRIASVYAGNKFNVRIQHMKTWSKIYLQNSKQASYRVVKTLEISFIDSRKYKKSLSSTKFSFTSQDGRLGQDVLINVGKGTEFVGGNAMMIVVETIAIIHC